MECMYDIILFDMLETVSERDKYKLLLWENKYDSV